MEVVTPVQGASLVVKILFTIVPLILSFIVYQAYKIYIKPKSKMAFYKKQGIPCEFVPLVGNEKYFMDGVTLHGDSQHYYKAMNGQENIRLKCSTFGDNVSLILRDLPLIKEFCLNQENYRKDPLYLELHSPLMGKGLLVADGLEWKNQRKLLSRAFHFEHLKAVMPMTRKTTYEILHDIRKKGLNGVDIMESFQDITGVVMGKIFFGELLNDYQFDGVHLTTALANLIADIGQLSLSPERFYLGGWLINQGILPKHRKLKDRIKRFRALCATIVQEKKRISAARANEQRVKDILDLLFEYTDEQGNKIDDEQLVSQFVTFFIAGMDTTGHLATMAVYYLTKYPHYLPRIMEEIKTHYKKGEDVSFDVLNKLEFMMAFLKETLRTMSPVPALLPRRAIRDHKLLDVEVKEGTVIEVDFFYNSFHPNNFPEPQKFDPERWMGENKPTDVYSFIPFGAGQRNCIGQHFALFEARIILSEFLQMYDFKLDEAFKLKMHSTFLYEPIDRIMLDLTIKNQQ